MKVERPLTLDEYQGEGRGVGRRKWCLDEREAYGERGRDSLYQHLILAQP